MVAKGMRPVVRDGHAQTPQPNADDVHNAQYVVAESGGKWSRRPPDGPNVAVPP